MEAAFFDLDKTLISRSSAFALGLPIYREGLLKRRSLAHGVYRQVLYSLFGADEDTMEKARSGMLKLVRGWDQQRVMNIVNSAIETVITPIVYGEAVDLIKMHRQAGRKVFIVSSSPEEIVRPLAGFFGVDDIIASKIAVENGKYTGELEFYAYGPHKATKIQELAQKEGLDLTQSYAYSDSITDLPMLEAVGNPVAVNADRALRRVAQEREWELLDFRRRMMLRMRIAVPSRKAVAGAAAIVTAAVVVILWHRSRNSEVPGLEQALVRLRLIKPRRFNLPWPLG